MTKYLLMRRALSFSFCHKGFLNGAVESHTHSSHGLGRNFVIYITNTTLSHLGAVILVKLHVTSLHKNTGGLVIDSISVRICGITNKYSLIRFGFELREAHTFLEDVALASENPEVLDVGFVAGENLVRIFVQTLPKI